MNKEVPFNMIFLKKDKCDLIQRFVLKFHQKMPKSTHGQGSSLSLVKAKQNYKN